MPEVVGRLRTPRLAAAPSTPAVGEMFYDTVANLLKWWDGTTWQTATGTGTVYDSDQIGTVKAFTGTTIPTNWMLADGRALSRTSYPQLFAAIGTVYGAGDGSTTFNIPDLRSRMLYGSSSATLADLGATGGEATHVLTVAEMPAHDHPPVQDFFPTMANTSTLGAGSSTGSLPGLFGATGLRGGGQAHNNLPPYILVAQIIKVTGATINAGGALVGATGPQGPQGPAGSSGAALVSALPGSPTDGQEIMFLADSTNGIIWHLRYRAASASAYKWESVGPTPLFWQSTVGLENITDGSTAHDAASVDGGIVLPLAGVFVATYGAIMDAALPEGAGQVFQNIYNVTDAATTAIGLDNAVRSNNYTSNSMSAQFTLSAANKTIRARYRTFNGVARRGQPFISIIPQRVG
jgi:microcystin-dependent protein